MPRLSQGWSLIRDNRAFESLFLDMRRPVETVICFGTLPNHVDRREITHRYKIATALRVAPGALFHLCSYWVRSDSHQPTVFIIRRDRSSYLTVYRRLLRNRYSFRDEEPLPSGSLVCIATRRR